MHGRRRDSEKDLHVAFGGCLPIQLRVVIDAHNTTSTLRRWQVPPPIHIPHNTSRFSTTLLLRSYRDDRPSRDRAEKKTGHGGQVNRRNPRNEEARSMKAGFCRENLGHLPPLFCSGRAVKPGLSALPHLLEL